MKNKKKLIGEKIVKIVMNIIIVLVLIVILFFFYWLFFILIRLKSEIFNILLLIILKFYIGNYKMVFIERLFVRYILNSFVIGFEIIIILIVIVSFVVYVIVKINILLKIKNFVLSLFLVVFMFL